MSQEIQKVSKHAAFDRFLNERVLGDRGFGIARNGRCSYSHEANGGCAIGINLPEAVAEQCDGFSGMSTAVVSPDVMQLCEPYLEDITSKFWSSLQIAHDNLAKALEGREGRDPINGAYQSFVDEMIRVVNILEGRG